MTDDTQALIDALRAGVEALTRLAIDEQTLADLSYRVEWMQRAHAASVRRAEQEAALLTAHADSLASDVGPTREELVAGLAWYGEQTRLARLIHSEGDTARNALDADGGKRARALIARATTQVRP